MKVAGVILAAGNASRYGGIKQLAALDGRPMLLHCLSAYQDLGLAQTVVVLGAYADKIEPIMPDWVDMVVNPDWQQGMGSSLASAIKWLHSDISHVLVGLADQPDISALQLAALLKRAKQYKDCRIAAEYAQGPGVPAIFPSIDFAALAKLNGDKGAKALLLAEPSRLKTLPMVQAATDIDTQDELKQWQQARGKRP
ncbi:nucleotidyltransferase family protein [Bowmanella denitrificans]|uniref:nucleotidyltransferase family protein n=1 Tax=Bowmanella denitrificans TaxID=366582 RepID=UPI000C9C3C7A|nr:nucleotidyltransferase family protein [Bowmanella denitrificans]